MAAELAAARNVLTRRLRPRGAMAAYYMYIYTIFFLRHELLLVIVM